MRVLVIGGTGFIGPYVVWSLADQGHDVTLFHRGQTLADLPSSVSHIHGDRAQLADFADAFRRLAPDVALDMRPRSEADAQAVTTAFRGIVRRLVAISSQDVYRAYGRVTLTEPGPPDPVPLTEESPLRERHFPYRSDPRRDADDPARWLDDYEKILVERAVMNAPDLPGTILRLPMTHGPGDNQHRLFPYLKRMDDGRPAIVLDERRAAWRVVRGFVENVADAIALAVVDDRAAGRIYNVGEPDALSETAWIGAIARVAGWPGRIVAFPAERLPEPLREDGGVDQHLIVDTTRLRSELGYAERVPRDEALRRTITWERANRPTTFDPAAFDYAAEDAVLTAAGQS